MAESIGASSSSILLSVVLIFSPEVNVKLVHQSFAVVTIAANFPTEVVIEKLKINLGQRPDNFF